MQSLTRVCGIKRVPNSSRTGILYRLQAEIPRESDVLILKQFWRFVVRPRSLQ